ncbi:hypothetical protein HKX48_008477 [Thoreauomyces humboldtii]|nr:hypothetical protein HKX48_008477 [Thoreauomyces humboldtii]
MFRARSSGASGLSIRLDHQPRPTDRRQSSSDDNKKPVVVPVRETGATIVRGTVTLALRKPARSVLDLKIVLACGTGPVDLKAVRNGGTPHQGVTLAKITDLIWEGSREIGSGRHTFKFACVLSGDLPNTTVSHNGQDKSRDITHLLSASCRIRSDAGDTTITLASTRELIVHRCEEDLDSDLEDDYHLRFMKLKWQGTMCGFEGPLFPYTGECQVETVVSQRCVHGKPLPILFRAPAPYDDAPDFQVSCRLIERIEFRDGHQTSRVLSTADLSEPTLQKAHLVINRDAQTVTRRDRGPLSDNSGFFIMELPTSTAQPRTRHELGSVSHLVQFKTEPDKAKGFDSQQRFEMQVDLVAIGSPIDAGGVRRSRTVPAGYSSMPSEPFSATLAARPRYPNRCPGRKLFEPMTLTTNPPSDLSSSPPPSSPTTGHPPAYSGDSTDISDDNRSPTISEPPPRSVTARRESWGEIAPPPYYLSAA